jgi:hypothetical protein
MLVVNIKNEIKKLTLSNKKIVNISVYNVLAQRKTKHNLKDKKLTQTIAKTIINIKNEEIQKGLPVNLNLKINMISTQILTLIS